MNGTEGWRREKDKSNEMDEFSHDDLE